MPFLFLARLVCGAAFSRTKRESLFVNFLRSTLCLFQQHTPSASLFFNCCNCVSAGVWLLTQGSSLAFFWWCIFVMPSLRSRSGCSKVRKWCFLFVLLFSYFVVSYCAFSYLMLFSLIFTLLFCLCFLFVVSSNKTARSAQS